MAKYSNSGDIYKELVEDSNESWLYGLVAFAVVEEQRIEWAKHVEEHTGSPPTPQEIDQWYQQQPPSVLLRAKGTAENALKTYSDEVVDLVMENQYDEIQEGIIVSEIRQLKAFWPQFGVNLAGGFVSAILFALVLSAFAFFVLNDTSPVEIVANALNEAEVIENGEK